MDEFVDTVSTAVHDVLKIHGAMFNPVAVRAAFTDLLYLIAWFSADITRRGLHDIYENDFGNAMYCAWIGCRDDCVALSNFIDKKVKGWTCNRESFLTYSEEDQLIDQLYVTLAFYPVNLYTHFCVEAPPESRALRWFWISACI
jgi:hypothetical protein